MKPEFALILSHDGIGLLHRTRAGWARLGEVSPDSETLDADLAALRRQAQSLAPHGMTTKVVIPASQILYTAIYAPGSTPAQRHKQIEAALDGVTPYPVSELVYDFSGSGQTVQVAVVARETLAEAEAFAQSHGLNPVSFVTIPIPGDFTGEPWFGTAKGAAAHLPEGAQVERDDTPIADIAAAPETLTESAAPNDASAEPPASDTGIKPPAQTEETEADPAQDLHANAGVAAAEGPVPASATPVIAEAEAEAEAEEALARPTAPVEPQIPAATSTQASEPEETVSPEDLADLAALDAAPDEGSKLKEPAPAPPETAAPPNTKTPSSAGPQTADPFSSARLLTQDATAASTPKLGGVARTSSAQGERHKSLTGHAAITAPGLDLPEPTPPADQKKDRKRKLGRAARKGLSGTAALGAAALSARAKAKAKPQPATKPTTTHGPAPSAETTVFGARKGSDRLGKPRYLGALMVGALVLFLAIVGLWTSFLSSTETPAPQDTLASSDTATAEPPADTMAALDPAPSAQPDASAEATAEPAPEASPVPSVTPEAAQPDANVATAEPETAQPDSAPSDTAQANTAQSDTAQADTAQTDTAASAPEQSTVTADAAPQAATPSPGEMPPFTAKPLPPPNVAPPETEAAPVAPTKDGVTMPGGFTLYAGKPPIASRARPQSVSQAYAATLPPAPLRPEDTLNALPALAPFQPTPRPQTLAAPDQTAAQTPAASPLPAQNDPSLADARPVLRPAAISSKAQETPTQTAPSSADDAAVATPLPQDPQLAGLSPKARPSSVADAAQAAKAAAEAAAAEEAKRFATATPLAVEASARPPEKPRDFSRSVEAALAAAIATPQAPAQTAAAAPTPAPAAQAPDLDEPEPTQPAPRLPTSASVAKRATEQGAINLRQMNLIGLYGSSASRRALIRLKTGRFVKVGVGDRLDGGTVLAIGSNQLTYQKGSRAYTLKMLQGG
ncbi:hypothetical protein DL1_05705 [Thioclava dalianensis]|uniref:Translation initiation factor 2 n=1 Tax=Thioclava dalianensis TaxID=1185766 RepID=A0A074U394_9RHOB|nr:hypothetical protein [Thioclava dalianensis]KEP69132.1 hypothetical protein DL1_05705 [Thioclava dalianensis]